VPAQMKYLKLQLYTNVIFISSLLAYVTLLVLFQL